MFRVITPQSLRKSPLLLESQCSLLHVSTVYRIKNYYDILGLPRTASAQEIKSAYYEKAKSYHPDAAKSNSNSTKFQEISEAYEVLSNQSKRRAYDSTTAAGGHFGNNFRYDVSKSVHRPATPIRMSHIHYVYKTINREEQPHFRPFEDHCYKGTFFNRFEYRRDWEPVTKKWVYSRRETVARYEDEMKRKTQILVTCVSALMFGTALFIFKFRFYDNMNRKTYYNPDEIPERSGIYFLRKD